MTSYGKYVTLTTSSFQFSADHTPLHELIYVKWFNCFPSITQVFTFTYHYYSEGDTK